ncbi:hypothetical protein LTR62_004468 [Meristemomyces frigidus]|uniref:Uncharacterized protein n=1 Tax=Meristemomyces frigidus TaxID=1508187 RepID=A0AAN7TQS0_9PEZI|nr:hypothetical protein LTR62_004468 [Meristemomyces frigidus]
MARTKRPEGGPNPDAPPSTRTSHPTLRAQGVSSGLTRPSSLESRPTAWKAGLEHDEEAHPKLEPAVATEIQKPLPKLKLNFRRGQAAKEEAPSTNKPKLTLKLNFRGRDSGPESNKLRSSILAAGSALPASTMSTVAVIDNDVVMTEGLSQKDEFNSTTNRPWGRKGKQPMRDAMAVNDDEQEDVDEGEIEYDDVRESENELSDSDDENPTREVITLSSDDEGAKQQERKQSSMKDDGADGLDYPWKGDSFTDQARVMWEYMYCRVETKPMHGNWDATEQYQMKRDQEMLAYLEVYPVPKWLIPQKEAVKAFHDLHERLRWRQCGVNIFAPQMPPPMHMQSPMGISPHIQQYGQPMHGPPGRQNSMSQLGMPYRQPQSPLNGAPPPGHVLRSQPNTMSLNVQPGQGYSMGPPPMPRFGHPQHVGGPHGMPNGAPQYYANYQPQYHQQHPLQNQPYSIHAPSGPLPSHSVIPPPGHAHARAALVPKGRKKKDTPQPIATLSPPRIPPFEKLERPAGPEKRVAATTSKRGARKQAECEEFPWHRDLDFVVEKANATWNEGFYEPSILNQMSMIRALNVPIIIAIDEELAEKQRLSRNRKNAQDTSTPPEKEKATAREAESEDHDDSKGLKRKSENIGGDPYYSGNFCFITEVDRTEALRLHPRFLSPDDILHAIETGSPEIDGLVESTKKIRICWNPGKKGTTQELVQASFRLYDTVITRQQYLECKILTKRAAECIIDFCPDMLWREVLLRVSSEGTCSNKDVRDRMCFNGCYADKATITKRIAAALGQKQATSANKKTKDATGEEETLEREAGSSRKSRGPAPSPDDGRWLEGELGWHTQNRKDFDHYGIFFGKRPNARRQAVGGEKRKKSIGAQEKNVDPMEGSSKRQKTNAAMSPASARSGSVPELSEDVDSDDEEDENEEQEVEQAAQDEEDDDDDAVSVQSDGVLDEIED